MGEQTILVREAESGDADALATIGTASFVAAYGPHSDPNDVAEHLAEKFSLDAVQRALVDGTCRYLLATVDGEPGGMAKVRPAECPVPGGDPNALELQQLYVLPTMQGHGLGGRLVANVLDVAASTGRNGVWLSAWELADWATGFYRRAGFAEIGKVEFKVGQTAYTDLLMWRAAE